MQHRVRTDRLKNLKRGLGTERAAGKGKDNDLGKLTQHQLTMQVVAVQKLDLGSSYVSGAQWMRS